MDPEFLEDFHREFRPTIDQLIEIAFQMRDRGWINPPLGTSMTMAVVVWLKTYLEHPDG